MTEKFTKEMSIREIIEECPDTLEVFANFGLGCIGCAMASYETVEQGAVAHGIDVNSLMKALNEKTENSTSPGDGCCCCGGL